MWSITKKIVQLFSNAPLKTRTYVQPSCRIGRAEEIGLDLQKIIRSKYAEYVQCGDIINSGRDANVFSVKGWEDSYIARVDKNSIFSAKSLNKKRKEPFNPIIVENFNGTVSLQKRIKGKPLYGENWLDRFMKRQPNTPEAFKETLKELDELPDEAYTDYINKIIEIREGHCNIDTINPNNFLLDTVNKKINIVDIKRCCKKTDIVLDFVLIDDFYPLLNHKMLVQIMAQMTPAECSELQIQVKNFLDRMISIAKKEGILLEMEPLNNSKPQDEIVYLYHNSKDYLNTLISKIKQNFK